MLTTPTDYAFWGVVVHLIVDWLFQNQWMATNKTSLRHPAAWVHSGLHTLAMLGIFPPIYALGIGIAHLLIDTRVPLAFWRRMYRQTTDGPYAVHVAIWGDQVAHIAVIAVATLLMFRLIG